MSQLIVFKKKEVIYHKNALKEYRKLPSPIKFRFKAQIIALEQKGLLDYPDAAKMSGYNNLYEIRIRYQGAWRGFYAYLRSNRIVVLHFFHKKSQVTPYKSINLALKRLGDYEE